MINKYNWQQRRNSFVLLLLRIILILMSVFKLSSAELPAETLSNVNKIKTIAYANDTDSAILQSSDGKYQLKFIKYNATSSDGGAAQDRRLLVVVNTQFNTTVVWIANRNTPVSPNATLSVDTTNSTASATIILAEKAPQPSATAAEAERNASNVVAWSTPGGVHSVQMNSSGNLVIWDSLGDLVWQSFDEATDVFVPGQFMRTGHNGTAYLAPNDVRSGHYSLRVEVGGTVLYASFDQQQNMVPYQYFAYTTGLVGTLNDTLHSPCNHSTMLYDSAATGIFLQQLVQSRNGSLHVVVTPECRSKDTAASHGFTYGTRTTAQGFPYTRFTYTGDVVSYFLDNSGLHVDSELLTNFFGTYCKLPSYCGINSVCSSVSNCTCPTLFSQIDDSDPSQGCRLDTPLNCSIADQHEFLAVNDVDYYANSYFTPHVVVSPAACTALCLPNCSCTAALYNNETGECFLYDTAQTLRSGGNPFMTAYLRVAKLPPTPGLSSGPLLSKPAIAGVTVGAAFLLVCLLLLSIWAGRRLTKVGNGDESDDEEEAFLESLPGLPPRYSYKELQIATDGFCNKLGKGGSGAVFEGQIDPRPARQRRNQLKNLLSGKETELVKVAIKELEVTERSSLASASKNQFRAEVATLGSLSHINLVQLKGFCAQGSHRLLIYEFLENGSLDRWIFSKDPNEILPWETRYRIAVDTARGLAFLHEGSRDKVMHLDVKPQNILLDGDLRSKLADFGLAKLIHRDGGDHNQTVTAVRGTPGYMAPEWFLNLPITEKSDVFSYGMVLLELVGGRKNVNLEVDSDAADDWYFPAWAVKQAENGHIVDIIDKRLMSGQDDVADRECESNMSRLIQVAFWCIQEFAASRPSMSTVLLMLEKHVDAPSPPLEHTYVLRRRSRRPP